MMLQPYTKTKAKAVTERVLIYNLEHSESGIRLRDRTLAQLLCDVKILLKR